MAVDSDLGEVSDAWERNAQAWLAWARTPGHDVFFSELNLPRLAMLLPAPGRRTLDLGCGEGRFGRWLNERGHCVYGIDSSPTLTEAARLAGGYEELVVGDGARLPWPADHFDAALACMSLQDMSDPVSAIAEVGRVLTPGGVLCIALPHPVNQPDPPEGAGYFNEFGGEEVISRNGLTMTFTWIERPLETYTRALSASSFVIEELREPHPDAQTIASHPELAEANSAPFFLHLRCRLA